MNHSYAYDAGGNRTLEKVDSELRTETANNLNQLTALTGGQGHVPVEALIMDNLAFSLPTNAVQVQGSSETNTASLRVLDASGTNYTSASTLPVNSGTNTFKVIARDQAGNAVTNQYSIVVSSLGQNATLTYDVVGNLISNVTATVTNSYQWDVKNQLVGIKSVTGTTTNETAFQYNGMSQRVGIREKVNGTVTSDKKYLWCGGTQPCEERDATGANVLKRYYSQGMQIATGADAGNYYYTKDHLGSIREMTDGTGNLRGAWDYDPFGRRTDLSAIFNIPNPISSDFGFTGHFYHDKSKLHLTLYRAYDADTGRWISRDPIAENGGINLYGYCANDPVNSIDPLGLWDWGNPATYFDGNPYGGSGFQHYRANEWESSAYASLDGLIPFADPFSNQYDPCDSYNRMSYVGGQVSQFAFTSAAGLGATRALNGAFMPRYLYHFTSGAGGAGINATGGIRAGAGLYGTGTYLTGFNSATYATLQGANSTAAVVRVSSAGLQIAPTYFPGTYVIRGASLLLP